ncbi:hypothetical protein HK405_004439, partial [Cladochytrium tenue]
MAGLTIAAVVNMDAPPKVTASRTVRKARAHPVDASTPGAADGSGSFLLSIPAPPPTAPKKKVRHPKQKKPVPPAGKSENDFPAKETDDSALETSEPPDVVDTSIVTPEAPSGNTGKDETAESVEESEPNQMDHSLVSDKSSVSKNTISDVAVDELFSTPFTEAAIIANEAATPELPSVQESHKEPTALPPSIVTLPEESAIPPLPHVQEPLKGTPTPVDDLRIRAHRLQELERLRLNFEQEPEILPITSPVRNPPVRKSSLNTLSAVASAASNPPPHVTFATDAPASPPQRPSSPISPSPRSPLSPVQSRARSMSPDFSIGDLRRDNAEAWMNRLREVQMRERRAQQAAVAAELAAAAAAEAAKLAREAALLVHGGGSSEGDGHDVGLSPGPGKVPARPLSPNMERQEDLRHRDAFDIAGDEGARERLAAVSSARESGGGFSPPVAILRRPGEDLGPYRRVYQFGRPAAGEDQTAASQRGLGGVVLSFASPPSTVASPKAGLTNIPPGSALFPFPGGQRLTSADFESGTAGDAVQVNVGRSTALGTPVRNGGLSRLPPLSVGGERRAVMAKPPFTDRSPPLSVPAASTSSEAASGAAAADDEPTAEMAFSPRLVLARPVGTASVTYRRAAVGSRSSASSNHSDYTTQGLPTGGYYRPATLATPISLVGRAVSLFSKDAPSVFSGLTSASGAGFSTTGLSAIRERGDTGPPPAPATVGAPGTTTNFPQAPTLPFGAITNSLLLFLKFRVFPAESERILAWCQGSVVAHLPARLADTQRSPAGSPLLRVTRRHSMHIPFLRTQFTSESVASSAPSSWNPAFGARQRSGLSAASPPDINLTAPALRAAYVLATSSAMYVFLPAFAMPRDPFSDAAPPASAAAAAADYLTGVAAQVRYDDPALSLRLWRRVPMSAVARVDVGPNAQYVAVHYVDVSATAAATAAGGAAAGTSGVAVVRSFTFVSRDRASTSALIASVARGRRRQGVVCADSDWNLRALRDTVWLRRSGEVPQRVVWDRAAIPPRADWRTAVFAPPLRDSSRAAAVPHTSWLGSLTSSIIFSTQSLPPLPSGSVLASAPAEDPHMADRQQVRTVDSDDDDPAAAMSANDGPPLYLSVGWMHAEPESSSEDGDALESDASRKTLRSVTVRSVTLTGTRDYLYLAAERLDVWPPAMFPPELDAGGRRRAAISAGIRRASSSTSNDAATEEDDLDDASSATEA